MTRHRTMACCVALWSLSLGFALATVPASAAGLPPAQPPIYGHTYGEWSAQWWQWVYAAPDGANPVQDTTGDFCAVNQPAGKVWFLAGTFGLTGVERSCTIPENRALFYPLVATVWN